MAVLMVGGLATARPCPAQDGGIALGSAAPVITVNDLDGNPVRLAEVIGKKPVLLEWWATWCDLCAELLPRVRAAREKYGDDVEFLGINVTVNQSPAQVRRYLERHRPPFRTLYDTEGTSVRAYQVPTTSFIVIVDRGGRVVYTGSGGDQNLQPALTRVTTAAAPERE